MTSQITEIRPVRSRAELEAVYDVLERVFPNGRAFFQERLDRDSAYDPETTWIASVDGAVASTIQLFPFESRVGDASVKIGGIGSVATLPEYRGLGLSQRLLQEQTRWMAAHDYDLSLLFAVITPFYEKSGWSVVPEPYYELDPGEVPTDIPAEYDIVPFDPSHLEEMAAIYERFNRSRTYTVRRLPSFWTDQLNWPRWRTSDCLVAMRDGRVVGYGQIGPLSESSAQLEEVLYLPGEEAAALDLFRSLLSLREGAVRITAKLPDDHALANAFAIWGAARKPYLYAMWKVIRFQPMLVKLASVFAQRLGAAPAFAGKALNLHLVCGRQGAYFHYRNHEVSVEPSPRPGTVYEKLAWTEPEFVRLLLQGGVSEPDREAGSADLLLSLFPKQKSVFYPTDKF